MVNEMIAMLLKVIFWLCVGLVAYNYMGYGILLFLLGALAQTKSDLLFLIRRKSRRQPAVSGYQPRVAILISAFNEEAVIETRVKNLLEIDYPEHLVELLIGLDAPDDSTPQILAPNCIITPSGIRVPDSPWEARRDLGFGADGQQRRF